MSHLNLPLWGALFPLDTLGRRFYKGARALVPGWRALRPLDPLTAASQTMTHASLPVVDLEDLSSPRAQRQERAAQALMQGFGQYGLVYIRNHGIDAATLDAFYDAWLAFIAQPEEAKGRGHRNLYQAAGVEPRHVRVRVPVELTEIDRERRDRRGEVAEDAEVASLLGVLSRNRRKFRQPINVACPAPGRWGRPNSRVTSRHFDHGNASRTSRPDCSGLDEAD